MSSHNLPSSSTAAHASQAASPPSRPTRPRLSRGISSRKPAPPPVPPSLRDHPLLDVVTHAGSSSSSSGASSHTSPASIPSSRQSSLAASPHVRPVDKIPIPLPSPTSLWPVPPRPSPPISGPWSTSAPCDVQPVGDAMGLLDTVPAGSTASVASPSGYPWHAMGSACVPPGTGHHRTSQGYDYVSMPLGTHRPSHRRPPRPEHIPARSPGQRHNVGTLHTHSSQPSPPVTPAAA